jgi:hypothetical protein
MIKEKDSEDILDWFKAEDFDKLEYLADIKHIVNNDDLTTDQKIKSIKMINEKAPKTKYDKPKYKLVKNEFAYEAIKRDANNSDTILSQVLLDDIGRYATSFTEVDYNIENQANVDYLKKQLNRQMYYVWLNHKADLNDILGLENITVYLYGGIKLAHNTEDYLIIDGQKITFDELKSGEFEDKIKILKPQRNN